MSRLNHRPIKPSVTRHQDRDISVFNIVALGLTVVAAAVVGHFSGSGPSAGCIVLGVLVLAVRALFWGGDS